jgi:glycosyltransferase involved in cell wall biosynthesis
MVNLKVLHLNNVANIGPILCKQQSLVGLNSHFIDLIKPFGASNIALKIIGSPIRLAHSLIIRGKIALGHYDIVHIHYSTSALFFLGIKPKLVVHAHGSDVRESDKNLFRFFLNKLIFKQADLIFYSTPDLKKHIDKYQVKAIFCPNPIDLENFNETKIAEYSIFIHASISWIKGADILIDALKKVRGKFPLLKISYLAFGDMLNEIQDLGLIEILKVQRSDLQNIISQNGLILGQFKVGAIGMSELEAMACCRPVVCHFEYDEDYPTPPPLIKAKTSEEIFNIIEKYIEDPEVYLKDKKKYRDWVIENHSKEKIERMIFKHYLSLF